MATTTPALHGLAPEAKSPIPLLPPPANQGSQML